MIDSNSVEVTRYDILEIVYSMYLKGYTVEEIRLRLSMDSILITTVDKINYWIDELNSLYF